ncbi:MAG: hypothetical protein ACI80S_000113 [Pseudohongiellaceae bacterium]|jgi:hypothetical protein
MMSYWAYKWNSRQLQSIISQRLSVFLWLMLVVTPAWSWGPLGHQAICDGAWRASSAATKKVIAAAAKRMGYNTFASGCLWADHIRGQKKYNVIKRLHYMNVPKTQDLLDTDPCGDMHHKKPSCVFSAITFYSKRWHNLQLPRRERDEALLLMVHFIGDIHQPLHVGFADDRGGTRRPIVFDGRIVSLHRFWDTEVLSCSSRYSWRHLGLRLFNNHRHHLAASKILSSNQKTSYLHPSLLEIRVWAQESYDLTRKIYQLLKVQDSTDYCSMFHDAAIKRLELASLRLALALKSN